MKTLKYTDYLKIKGLRRLQTMRWRWQEGVISCAWMQMTILLIMIAPSLCSDLLGLATRKLFTPPTISGH